jgi:hypothetical protein
MIYGRAVDGRRLTDDDMSVAAPCSTITDSPRCKEGRTGHRSFKARLESGLRKGKEGRACVCLPIIVNGYNRCNTFRSVCFKHCLFQIGSNKINGTSAMHDLYSQSEPGPDGAVPHSNGKYKHENINHRFSVWPRQYTHIYSLTVVPSYVRHPCKELRMAHILHSTRGGTSLKIPSQFRHHGIISSIKELYLAIAAMWIYRTARISRRNRKVV